MSYETARQTAEEPEEHRGDKYLAMLGLTELAHRRIPGRTEEVRDFLGICAEHALPALVMFDGSKPDDPMYTDPEHPDYTGLTHQEMYETLQNAVIGFATPPQAQES